MVVSIYCYFSTSTILLYTSGTLLFTAVITCLYSIIFFVQVHRLYSRERHVIYIYPQTMFKFCLKYCLHGLGYQIKFTWKVQCPLGGIRYFTAKQYCASPAVIRFVGQCWHRQVQNLKSLTYQRLAYQFRAELSEFCITSCRYGQTFLPSGTRLSRLVYLKKIHLRVVFK